MPHLFLLVNTVILINQRQTLSSQNINRHCPVRFYAFVGQPFRNSCMLFPKKVKPQAFTKVEIS